MVTTINSYEGDKQIHLPNNENDFYHDLAEYLTTLEIPNNVLVENTYGKAVYTLTKRSGTLFIQEICNSFCFTDPGERYHTVYLTCINGDKNNYKYYKMFPISGGMIRASYGRIGTVKGEMFGERSYDYPERMFWIKYQEKISKGYEDKSEFYVTEQEDNRIPEKEMKPAVSSVSQELYDKLKAWAKQTVESTLGKITVTEAMVSESRKLLNMLYETKGIDEFNSVLLKLLAVSPRKVWRVDDLLAKSPKDFADIVQREEDLLHAMMALVGSNIYTPNAADDNDFARAGIKVTLATKQQKDNVISMLSYSLRGKVKNVYRIKSASQTKRFKDYLKREHLDKSNIRGFWHGSRNQNWLSIIENGLLLHPNAIITGKMFGNGIYFAPSSMKSWGYTNVGRWTGNGYADTVYMGLYATAYGDPLYTKQVRSYSGATIGKHNCVHAKAGECGLRNDEVIFYDEAAVLLEYLVEFTA